MKRDIASYRTRLQDISAAEKYAKRFETGSRRRIDRQEQTAVRHLLADLPACRTVLDIPSGAGRFLTSLGRDGTRVLCMDSALEILQFARRNSVKKNIAGGCAQADAARLPLRDQAVDLVFCNRLLHHILKAVERKAILRELARVTRRHVIVSFFDYRKFGAMRTLLKKLRGRQPPYVGQPTLDEFAAEAAECGLNLRTVQVIGPVWVSQKYLLFERAKRAAA